MIWFVIYCIHSYYFFCHVIFTPLHLQTCVLTTKKITIDIEICPVLNSSADEGENKMGVNISQYIVLVTMNKYMYFAVGELLPRLLIVEMTLGSPLLHPVKSHPLEAKAGNPSSKRSRKRYIYIFVKKNPGCTYRN